MRVFSQGFLILSYVGMWRPLHWTSSLKVSLYGIYNVTILLAVCCLAMGQLVHLIRDVRNFDDFTSTTLILMTAINIVFKGSTMLLRRADLVQLCQRLLEFPHRSLDPWEKQVELRFDRFARLIIVRFTILIVGVASAMIAESIVLARKYGALISPTWYPFDHSKSHLLALCWLHQSICFLNGGIANACCDAIFVGLLLKISSQLEILKIRIHRCTANTESPLLREERKQRLFLGSIVDHHNHIFKFANDLNEIFSPILFAQFFLGIMLICSLVHHFSVTKPTTEFVPLAMYLIGVLAEVFLYCWFGNQVILSSLSVTNAIYSADWTTLSAKAQRDLVIVMLRAKSPIRISSSFLVTLSTQSFITILKTSYSMFSLLRSTHD